MVNQRDIENLKRAKALIQEPNNWIKHSYAKTAEGARVDCRDPRAVKFCAMGALYRVGGYSAAGFLTKAAADIYGVNCVTALNDNGTHKEILELYDRAIAEAKSAT